VLPLRLGGDAHAHSPSPFYLDLPSGPWSLEELRVAVERHRGRTLILEPASLSHEGSAIWVATHVADLIVYDQAADLARRIRAIGHQFGHMLLGHQARHDGQQPLFPHLEPTLISPALTISRYVQADELEADDFASLVVANSTHS
jgi:hypothetical protein